MNAYNFDLHIKTNRPNNLSLSIEIQYTMVDCLSYFMECLSLYFLFDFHLEKDFHASMPKLGQINAYGVDLHILSNRNNNLILSIELQYYMVDCLSYLMECMSSYFPLGIHL